MCQAEGDEDRTRSVRAAIEHHRAKHGFNGGRHRLVGDSWRAVIQDDAVLQTTCVADSAEMPVRQLRLLDLSPLAFGQTSAEPTDKDASIPTLPSDTVKPCSTQCRPGSNISKDRQPIILDEVEELLMPPNDMRGSLKSFETPNEVVDP